jgi:hypothetical protein
VVYLEAAESINRAQDDDCEGRAGGYDLRGQLRIEVAGREPAKPRNVVGVKLRSEDWVALRHLPVQAVALRAGG